MLFYTHLTDCFTPFHIKVIAANAGEAAHVLDGLLGHESELFTRQPREQLRRGNPALDVDALAAMVERFAAVMQANLNVREVDLHR